jgi:hypothetical protein
MKFYLGTHETSWLQKTTIPLFVSHRRLSKRKTLPRALCAWALDSGGFSELSLFGEWRTSAKEYAGAVRRYAEEIGGMEWAASCDWMCEPFVLAKTGLTVREHQRRTVNNYLELLSLAPDLPFVPVLQGWERGDYLRHVEDYARVGIDLKSLPRVGLGSVCRRQHTRGIQSLVRQLHSEGLKLHGFGVKLEGLREMADELLSADSMAWSFGARRKPALPNHPHKSCANCRTYAELWYRRVQFTLSQPRQRWLMAA